MRRLFVEARNLFARLLHSTSGVAAVEFALVVPIMLAVYVGCAEAASLLTVDRKVQSVAGAVGDLVARSNQSLTRSQMEDYFRAATSIMTPYDITGLTQTVTAVTVNDEGEASVLWSVSFADGVYSSTVAEHPVGSEFDLPEEMAAIALGQTVIAAEADYDYTALLGIVYRNAIELNRSGFYMPRFGGEIQITS